MTTQELIDYLVAQVKSCPELADREVLKWDETDFYEVHAQPVWICEQTKYHSNEPYEDYKMRIEIQ